MENFQIACFLAGMVFLAGVLRKGRSAEERTFVIGLLLFYGSFIVLEVDTRRLGMPLLEKIFNGRIRDIWLLLFWLGGAWMFIRNARQTLHYFVRWLRRPSGIVLLLAGTFWMAAVVMDKGTLGVKSLFVEELMEVAATWLMMQSAGLTWFWQRRGDEDGF